MITDIRIVGIMDARTPRHILGQNKCRTTGPTAKILSYQAKDTIGNEGFEF